MDTRLFVAITLALTLSGCAITTTTQINESYFRPIDSYSPALHIDRAAHILMTTEERSHVHTSRSAYLLGYGSQYSFQIGKITEEAAKRVFERVFTGGVKVEAPPAPIDGSIVIHPVVTNLEWWFRTTAPGYNYQEVVQLSLLVEIKIDGDTVFNRTYTSGEVGGDYGHRDEDIPLGTQANKVVHETIGRLMEKAASDYLSELSKITSK